MMAGEYTKLDSSNLAGCQWEDGTLRIMFVSGQEYEYTGVDQAVYDGLVMADSPGRYFNDQIKNKYSARKL
jgi:hypothetical protein